MENNEPAFPTTLCEKGSAGTYKTAYRGLTKRELFAAMAMQGLLSGVQQTDRTKSAAECVADAACGFADALLAALEQPGSGGDQHG